MTISNPLLLILNSHSIFRILSGEPYSTYSISASSPSPTSRTHPLASPLGSRAWYVLRRITLGVYMRPSLFLLEMLLEEEAGTDFFIRLIVVEFGFILGSRGKRRWTKGSRRRLGRYGSWRQSIGNSTNELRIVPSVLQTDTISSRSSPPMITVFPWYM